MGSQHGPLFALVLCTLLLTDTDKESELKEKVCYSGMDGSDHRGSVTMGPMSQSDRFPREMRKKMLVLSHVSLLVPLFSLLSANLTH